MNNNKRKCDRGTRNKLEILSWNIQSRNSRVEGNKCLQPDFLKLITSADLICLQETKKPIKIQNYRCYNSNRPGGPKLGGGVAILVDNKIRQGATRVSTPTTHDAIAVKLSKHFFNTKKDTYIICVYISPSTSPYRKRLTTNPWDLVSEFISSLKSKGDIIVCGDMNARTSTTPDYVMNIDLDQLNLPPDLTNLGDPPPPRNNMDTFVNGDCDELIDVCVSNDLIILNGRTLGDLFGTKTFYGPRGTSTPDYSLAPLNMYKSIMYMKVLPFTRFSDHRSLKLRIDLKNNFSPDNTSFDFQQFPSRFKWREDSANLFRHEINTTESQQLFDDIINNCDHCKDSSQLCNSFTKIIIDAATRSLKKVNMRKKIPNHKWFNKECVTAKRRLNRAARRASKYPEVAKIRQDYYTEKRLYKACLNKHKTNYLKNANEAIENGKIIDWKFFKSLKQTHDDDNPLDNYDLASFCDYFEKLYQPSNIDINTSNYTINPITTSQEAQDDLNKNITITETKNVVRTLKGENPWVRILSQMKCSKI